MADSYVTSTATLSCPFGSKKVKLNVLPTRTVFLTGKPMANISDHIPGVNIPGFGKCRSLAYPPTAAATAANHGKLTPMPCMPGTNSEWIAGKSDYIVKGKPALLKSSRCICQWGGVITVTDDGQTDTGPADIKTDPIDTAITKVEEPVDIYLTFYFNTLDKQYLVLDKECDHNIAEGLVFRNIIPDSGNLFSNLETKINHTFFINCADCLINDETGAIADHDILIKVLQALECLEDFTKKYKYSGQEVRVWTAIFATDLVEDIALSFAYVLDEEAGMPVLNEELYPSLMECHKWIYNEYMSRHWFLYVSYLTILDYYIISTPIQRQDDKHSKVENHSYDGNSSVEDINPGSSNRAADMGTITKTSEELPAPIDDDGYAEKNDAEVLLKGGITYDHQLEPVEKAFVDKLTEVLGWVSILPGIGSFAGLANGYIYTTMATTTAFEDRDASDEYKTKAYKAYLDMIPYLKMIRVVRKMKELSKLAKKAQGFETKGKFLERAMEYMQNSKVLTKVEKARIDDKLAAEEWKLTWETIWIKKDLASFGLRVEDLTRTTKGFLAKNAKTWNNFMKIAENTNDSIMDVAENVLKQLF